MANDDTIYNLKSQSKKDTRKPMPDDYIPTRIMYATQENWLTMTSVAQNLYIIIAGSPGASSTGFVSSINSLIEIYKMKAKKKLSWNRIKKGIEELASNGWVTQQSRGAKMTAFLIPSKPGMIQPSTSTPPIEVTSTPPIEVTSTPPIEDLYSSDRGPSICRSYSVEATATTAVREAEKDPPSVSSRDATAVVDFSKIQKTQLCDKIQSRFANSIPTSKIMSLIASTSLENVQNQFDWFWARNINGFSGGEVVAFVTFCRDEVGEPAVIRTQKLAMARKKAEEIKLINAKKAKVAEKRKADDANQRVELILGNLSVEQIDQIKTDVVNRLGDFYQGEDTYMFRNMFRSAILAVDEHAKKVIEMK